MRNTHRLVPALFVSAGILLSWAGTASAGFDYSKAKSDSKSFANIGGSYYAGASASAVSYEEMCQSSEQVADMFCAMPGFPLCSKLRDEVARVCDQVGYVFDAEARAEVDVKLFGNNFELAKVEIYAQNDDSGASAGMGLYGAGTKLWGADYGTTVSGGFTFPIYGVSKSKSIKIAGIKVKVEAEAGALAGIEGEASASQSGLVVSGGPFIAASASASAGGDVLGFGGGVSGSLTLARVDGVGTGALEWTRSTITASGSFDLILTFLKGSLEVWVKMFGERVGDWTLFEYDGIVRTFTLGSGSQTWNL